ncbi:MAG: hypothetical protein II961_09645 [Candidatus Riflebacteria bacterium]|nr:hypothetical protein [Candidatus Riflebacteria bacterium]
MKRILVVFLGIFFAIPAAYAENPFADDEITVKESTSANSLETADITTKDNNKEEQKEESGFPIKGKLGWDGVRLREWPWGPIIDTFNKSDLTVLSVSGDFYEVEISGVKGYMHKNFIHVPDCAATGKQPYYPGNTWEGGYLSREEGIKVSNAAAAASGNSSSSNTNTSKKDSEKTNSGSTVSNDSSSKSESKDTVVSSTNGISASEFNNLLNTMETPTKDEIIKLAATKGITADYVKILVGTTQREGYFKDPYLHYGWASAMINCPVTIKQMQGWDPSRSGDANYYSQANIDKGYNSASADVLKSVYLALKYRNTKIVECNGMYKTTPKSYNKIYGSSVYNCSIYEKK